MENLIKNNPWLDANPLFEMRNMASDFLRDSQLQWLDLAQKNLESMFVASKGAIALSTKIGGIVQKQQSQATEYFFARFDSKK